MKRAVIRLPPEIIDRLDRLADALRAAHPDERYSRASVARALISSGLLLAERDDEDRDMAQKAARRTPHPRSPSPPPPLSPPPPPRLPGGYG